MIPSALDDYRPFYNEKTKTIEMPDEEITLPAGGLGKLLFENMKQHGDKVAQIDPEIGIKETHAQLFIKVIRTAIELKSLGLKPGDVTLLCTNNHLNNIVPYLASIFNGGISAGLDPSFTQSEIAHMVNLVKPKFIFVIPSAKAKLQAAVDEVNLECKVFVFEEDFEQKFLLPKHGEDSFEVYHVDDNKETAIILFSSGSTGFPKAICLNHEHFLYGTKEPFVMNAVYTSLYWGSAVFSLIGVCRYGSWRLILNIFDAKKLWDYIYKYELPTIFLAPVIAIDFFYAIPKEVNDCPLKACIIGGSSLATEHLKRFMEMLPKTMFMYGYGQTELAMTLSSCIANTKPDKLGSVGTPIYGRHYRIVDPDTEEVLGFNKPGELRVKTKWIMNGYYKQDILDQFDKDGFFKTGDMLYYDEDFYFYIVDRVKEMFKYRSWHIVPAKIESILAKHPAVDVSVVVGIPHPTDDAHAMAIVRCKRGSSITEDELCKYVNDQVDDRHQLRAGVVIVDDFVYTNTGKIQRRKTRDMVMNKLGKSEK